jgi:hypothetical protein
MNKKVETNEKDYILAKKSEKDDKNKSESKSKKNSSSESDS